MKKSRRRIVGRSYAARVAEINRIYDEHSHSGLSNREILRQFIWPKYPISEKSFYNIINAMAKVKVQKDIDDLQMKLFFD